MTTFENTGAQFEWISMSLIPVLSKEHRSTYVTNEAEMANNAIRKITISNLKDIDNNNLPPRVYNLDEFDDYLNFTGNTWHIFQTVAVQKHFSIFLITKKNKTP